MEAVAQQFKSKLEIGMLFRVGWFVLFLALFGLSFVGMTSRLAYVIGIALSYALVFLNTKPTHETVPTQ
jgi:hypothetical protein